MIGRLSGSREPSRVAPSRPDGFDPGRCFKLLADLHAALVMTADYAPDATVGSLVESSAEFKRADDFLLENQHIGDNQ